MRNKPSEEFQDRQNVNADGSMYEIGELPEDISRERGDLDPYYFRGPKDARLDVRAQDVLARASKEVGTVPYAGNSISQYESRPINAIDFSATAFAAWTIVDPDPDPDIMGTNSLAMVVLTVPQGFNAALTGFRYAMVPTIDMGLDDLLVDVQINGASPIRFQGLMHGQVLADYVKTWIIAGPGDTIGLNFRTTFAAMGGVEGVTRNTHVELIGNYIQDTGLPLNQEFSNKRLGKPISQVPGKVRVLRPKRQRVGPFKRF